MDNGGFPWYTEVAFPINHLRLRARWRSLMKRYSSILLTALCGGALAFALRLLHCRTGFEADSGLPIPGNVFAVVLPAALAVLAAALVLLCRKLPVEKGGTPLTFPAYFQARDALVPTLMVTGAFLWLISGALDLVAGAAYGRVMLVGALLTSGGMFSPQLTLLSGALTLLSALALLPVISACRTGGKRTSGQEADHRRPMNANLLLVPVASLVLRLVMVYREDSVNPSIAAYYVELLALAALILAFYRASSFGFRCGRTRRFVLCGAGALSLSMSTLADSHAPASTLLYAGGALLVTGLLLMRFAALEHETAKTE